MCVCMGTYVCVCVCVCVCLLVVVWVFVRVYLWLCGFLYVYGCFYDFFSFGMCACVLTCVNESIDTPRVLVL